MPSNKIIVSIRLYHKTVANDKEINLCNSSGPIKSGFKVIEGRVRVGIPKPITAISDMLLHLPRVAASFLVFLCDF